VEASGRQWRERWLDYDSGKFQKHDGAVSDIEAGVTAFAGTSPSGSGAAAGRLVEEHLWKPSTRKNRHLQWERWLVFCDEDGRSPMPATSRDVVAYIGWLCLHGRVSAASWPQYVAAISMFHVLAGYPSPPRGHFIVAELLRAGAVAPERGEAGRSTRGGLSAAIMRRVCNLACTRAPMPIRSTRPPYCA
jgi:hypothetical protein